MMVPRSQVHPAATSGAMGGALGGCSGKSYEKLPTVPPPLTRALHPPPMMAPVSSHK